jgi:hypothetical protein
VATATPTRPSAHAAAPAHTAPLATLLTHWHLLSLDAPTVATLWTWFIARANHIHLPASSLFAMAIAVWMLYAADRLMDARLMDARLMDARPLDAPYPHVEDLEARHLFHHFHRLAFLAGILIASALLATLLPRLEAAALHLYLILGALLTGYFILIHAAVPVPIHVAPTGTSRTPHRLPKEIAVGIFFSAATFIPTVARRPDLRLTLLAPALLFSALCSLNCLFIYAWEHPNTAHPDTIHPNAHPATRLALRHLQSLAIAIALFAAALTATHRSLWPIAAGCGLAACLLLLLHRSNRNRAHLPPTVLRAAADLALLTPALLAPLLRLLR